MLKSFPKISLANVRRQVTPRIGHLLLFFILSSSFLSFFSLSVSSLPLSVFSASFTRVADEVTVFKWRSIRFTLRRRPVQKVSIKRNNYEWEAEQAKSIHLTKNIPFINSSFIQKLIILGNKIHGLGKYWRFYRYNNIKVWQAIFNCII